MCEIVTHNRLQYVIPADIST